MTTTERDLDGKEVVITGANTGIGRATAENLAARGAHVTLACRSEERTRPVLDAIAAAGGRATFVPLDLASLADVRACGERLAAIDKPLDILINNAGLAAARSLTKDGFEIAFGTNHLGHFLLTMLLMPRLRAAKGARIVNVASRAHYSPKGIDWDAVRAPTRTRTALHEYGVSKLANVLFTKELARRLGDAGPHAYSLHPGVVASDVWREVPWPVGSLIKLFMISNEDGAKTTLYCATSPETASHSGRYYDKSREKRAAALADDEALARTLWEKSAAWTGADLR
jgi:NAD(P)-dependent dehydrogenase (short-subunit alcohol dehydrogenase family)